MSTKREGWWQELYDDTLADVLLERADENEVKHSVDFLVKELRLRPGDRVFDQCCGVGSLSLPLAERGFSVTGVDQADEYVERARRRAKVRELGCRFVAGDAFEWLPPERCRGAFNWWTSFGYAESDDDNARMLVRAYEALEPGGRFVLDTMNLPGVMRGFAERVVTRRQTPRGPVTLTRQSAFDLARGRLQKLWVFDLPDGRRIERPSSVRLYLPHTLRELFEVVGFRNCRFFGNVREEPLALDSPRCIVVGEKPVAC
jgi:SAM-dependent methyltransferase